MVPDLFFFFFNTDYNYKVPNARWNANRTAERPSSGIFTFPRGLLEAIRVLRFKSKGDKSKNGNENTPAQKVTAVLWEWIEYTYYKNELGCVKGYSTSFKHSIGMTYEKHFFIILLVDKVQLLLLKKNEGNNMWREVTWIVCVLLRLWHLSRSSTSWSVVVASSQFFIFVHGAHPCDPIHPPSQLPAYVCTLLNVMLASNGAGVSYLGSGGGKAEWNLVCYCFPSLYVALCDSVIQTYGGGERPVLEQCPVRLRSCHLCIGCQ